MGLVKAKSRFATSVSGVNRTVDPDELFDENHSIVLAHPGMFTPVRFPAEGSDGPSVDSFSRWRTSEANYVFDAQFEYDLQPLLFQAVTAESGATVAHDATNRTALMTFADTPTGGKAYIQSYENFRYQAGRSQLCLMTFNFVEKKANVLKFVGYSDGANGIEFQANGTQLRWALLSDTSKGDEFVNQANWSIDPLDGTGASGITLDVTKTHIAVIDFQWLGVGRVRVGFDIGGNVYYVHEFNHANVQTVPYMQTANLPVRIGMTCSGTVSTTMRSICASVSSEGGETDVGGYVFGYLASGTAGNDADAHIVSIRPAATFNSIVNRSKVVLESIEVIVTGNNAVAWKAVLGQAITGTTTFTATNATYSAIEANTAGAITGTAGIVFLTGYVAASATTKGAISRAVSNRYPITLDYTGTARSMGTISVIASGIGATSTVRVGLNWREIR